MAIEYTINTNNETETNQLLWKELHAARYAFNSPFHLHLHDGQLFYAERVVRIVPKKRLVAYGLWQNKPVYAKLFFDSQHAKHHLKKDIDGIRILQKNCIPTPNILLESVSADRKTYVLFLEPIEKAQSLDEVVQTNDKETLFPILQSVTVELATQHVLGVLQHDLHLKNFLLTPKTIYTLDGAAIEWVPQLLSKKASMTNLALFLSQLGIGQETIQTALFTHYAQSRGWLIRQNDVKELGILINKCNEKRWKQFEKKLFRSSTKFSKIHRWNYFAMVDRDYTQDEFLFYIQQPEQLFAHPSVKVLKDGRSSTVIEVTINQKKLVVKRYNLKHLWHRFRRLLRPTRAAHCWRIALKLNLFGVKTAKPIAFIEQRLFGIRGKAYFISAYLSDQHIGDYLNQYQKEDERVSSMINKLAALFNQLLKLKIVHGDLKTTNILIDQHGEPTLIDLDGAKEHESIRPKMHDKDLLRFLENFNLNPPLRQKIKSYFKSSPAERLY